MKIFSFLCFVCCIFFANPVFSQPVSKTSFESETNQIITPHEIFIGDTVFVQYVFRTPVEIVAENAGSTDGELSLRTDFPIFSSTAEAENCTVKKISLIHTGLDYNFTVSFVPWKPGVFSFREFDIQDILSFSGLSKSQKKKCTLKIAPVSVLSVSEKTHATLLQPPASPILVPGTIYVVYALIAGAALSFTALCFLLAHIKRVVSALKRLGVIMGYGKNARRAARRARRLLRSSESDAVFCAELQEITRSYLSYRFDRPFSTYDTRELEKSFFEISEKITAFSQKMRIEELIALFRRTDYIRYAVGSLDSKLLPPAKHDVVLLDGERKEMVDTVCNAIAFLERGGE